MTKAAVWAEASKAGQPIDDLRQQRKDAWLLCLNLAAVLAELRTQGEAVRARADEHVRHVVARVPVAAAEDGSVLGDELNEESGAAGAAGVATVEEVRALMAEAKDALEQWRQGAVRAKRDLAHTTDEAARGLTPEVTATRWCLLACVL